MNEIGDIKIGGVFYNADARVVDLIDSMSTEIDDLKAVIERMKDQVQWSKQFDLSGMKSEREE